MLTGVLFHLIFGNEINGGKEIKAIFVIYLLYILIRINLFIHLLCAYVLSIYIYEINNQQNSLRLLNVDIS